MEDEDRAELKNVTLLGANNIPLFMKDPRSERLKNERVSSQYALSYSQ